MTNELNIMWTGGVVVEVSLLHGIFLGSEKERRQGRSFAERPWTSFDSPKGR